MHVFLLWVLLEVSPAIPLQTTLQSSTQQAEDINRVTNYFFLAAGCMLLLVTTLTIFILYKFWYKRKDREETNINTKWEYVMIGVPTALVGIFLYLSITTMNRVHASTEGTKPDVTITAHQWWWEINYAGTDIITANEIHLPAGKKILLKLLSADVIHDWWVPRFGSKMDMIPSQENHLWITIRKPGEYSGICSEFCGPQHAHMRIKVIAQNENDFNNWLAAQNLPAADSTLAGNGKNLFMTKTCSNCHRINGTEANGDAGPDLTHMASRQTLLAGMLVNNVENLQQWLQHPQQIKPGAHMPDFLLDDSSANAIATYLYSLK